MILVLVDEICALLRYFAVCSAIRNAVSGNTVCFIIKSQEIFLDFLSPKDGTDIVSRNVGKEVSPLGFLVL